MAIPSDRHLAACLEVLYRSTLEARILGWRGTGTGLAPDDSARLADLMDAVHNIPQLILRWDTVDEKRLRQYLADYDDKWGTVGSLRLLEAYESKLSQQGAG